MDKKTHHQSIFNGFLTALVVILLSFSTQSQILQESLFSTTQLSIEDEEEDEWDKEDYRGFSIALDIGAYFAGKKSASLYNGSCPFEVDGEGTGVRCYTIMERLTLNLQDISFITNYYNIQGFEAPIDIYPINMRYQPAFLYGANIKYNFDRWQSIVFDASFVRVKSIDQFTLRFVGGEVQQNAQQNIQLFTIWGEEQRFDLALGYRTAFEINQKSNSYLEFGGSMLGTKMEANKVTVAERNFDLILNGSNPQQLLSYRPRTAVGFGAYMGAGVEMEFEKGVRMELGAVLYWDKVIIESFNERVCNFALVSRFGI